MATDTSTNSARLPRSSTVGDTHGGPMTLATHSPAAIDKLALTRTECAPAMGVCVRTIDKLIADRASNGFPVCYVGKKPLVPIRPLEDWLARQSAEVKR